MDNKNKVLLIGVDTSKIKFTDNPEMKAKALEIMNGAKQASETLKNKGYDSKCLFLDINTNPKSELINELINNEYTSINVGAGLRTHPDTLLLFENVINIIHKNAPNATIGFSADYKDIVAAIQRQDISNYRLK